MLLATETIPPVSKSVKIIASFYSLWNLDLSRSVLPEICLDVNTLQAFALDVCIVVYPLLLILVSYSLIELYDHNIECIVFIWKPFRLFFRLLREIWDIHTSMIDSFVSFFLLSYARLLSVSMHLMLATLVHELHSNKSLYRLYYAGK